MVRRLGVAYALDDDDGRGGRPRERKGRHVPAHAALAGHDGEPWASVLIVHGLAEHSGRYEHVGRSWPRPGIDAHAFDQRGFGGSGGPRASIDRWSQIHDDLEERLGAVRSIAPARPLVLYGHSLGGLIALGYVLDGRALPDLLVLSAPAIQANLPLPRLAVSVLKRVAPNTMLKNTFDADVLSRDPEVGRKYVSDPLNQHRTTARFAHAALRGAAQGLRGDRPAVDPDARRAWRLGHPRPDRVERGLRGPAGRGSEGLPGAPPRGPQRAGGRERGPRDRRLDPRAGEPDARGGR